MRTRCLFSSLSFSCLLMFVIPALLAVGYEAAPPFTLADLETGSTRFTNSNEVDLAELPVPEGYDLFQFTEDGDPGSLGAWSSTSAVPATVSFAQPSADAEITLYAWFTNTSDAVSLRRSEGAILHTEVAPEVAPLSALTLETTGFSVRITGADIDASSTGGMAVGEPMGIHALEALWDGGDDPDLTPGDPFVTLTNAGVYTVKLRAVNAAGNVAEATTASTVTLQAPVKTLPTGDRYVVAHNLNAAAPYTNWTTAAASIQTAVNATVANNETILVWPGRYTAPTNAVDFESATNVVYLNRPVTLRSVAGAAETFIDGEGANRGIAVSYSGNVRFTVDGFTIVNGFASSGGGAHVSTHNFTCEFFNCVFVDNTAVGAGGAIRADQTSAYNYTTLAITNTVFRNNQTLDGSGGAIFVTWTHLQIDDSRFEDNRVDANTHNSGGAISFDRGGHRFENTVFRNNHASSSGSAGTGGGAFHLDRGTLLMRNCLLTGNSGVNGGGIRVGINGASVELDNCSIVHNGSNSGIWFRHKTPYFHAYNSILYGNSGDDIRIGSHSDPRTIDIRHCLYGSATIGTTENDTVIMSDNLHANPLFVDPTDGNFRLQRESPAINAGMPRDWHDGAVDLDGKRRVDGVYNQVDLGAYEYRYAATILLVR